MQSGYQESPHEMDVRSVRNGRAPRSSPPQREKTQALGPSKGEVDWQSQHLQGRELVCSRDVYTRVKPELDWIEMG